MMALSSQGNAMQLHSALILAAAALTGCATYVPADGPSNLSVTTFNGKLNKDVRTSVVLHIPAQQAPHKPAVILMTGCDGFVTDGARGLTAALMREGVLVAELKSIEAHGNTCPRPTINGSQRAEEAFKTRDALVARGLATEENVGLLGFSHGGWAISNAIFPSNKTPFAAAVSFYPGCQTMETANLNLKTPTLILTGSADDWAPTKPCERMAEAAADQTSDKSMTIKIVEFKGATHAFDHNAPGRYMQTKFGTSSFLQYDGAAATKSMELSMAWFTEHLKK
jgi:dienelactone hydrolase